MRAKLTRRLEMGPTHPDYVAGTTQYVEAGDVLEHPQAFWLVRQGVAEPADDECEKAARMTATQKQAAREAYERVSRGIHPEDYEAFELGEIDGYVDGEPIPGPASEDD